MRYYDHFVIPFTIGVIALFAVIGYKYVRWFVRMPVEDKTLVKKGIFSTKTFGAIGEVVMESLLHRRIFRVNPLLGYMHMSLAFGWFLLIVVGWVEAAMHLTGNFIPIYAHVFFKYFAPTGDYRTSAYVMSNIMDFLLLFVLSGVALAWIKRLRSRALGMRRTTKHTTADRICLSVLWLIFPVRLLAESAFSGINGTSTFLTGNLGEWMLDWMDFRSLYIVSSVSWWVYSIILGVFMITLPFSRYMHIFTEIPLIFLRRYKVRSAEKEKSFDHFQIEACSRCGICIDPCQLQRDAGVQEVQSVYFLRDRRYNMLSTEVTANCLMCGRCDRKCPVGIELSTLRLNSRTKFSEVPAEGRYNYLERVDTSSGHGKTAYFAGCMTLLTPYTLRSMEKIFEAAGESVLWADREGGVCCGRPLKLSGELAASRKMMDHNTALFRQHGITRLITSCPICFRVFREDYRLEGVEILHHTEYIAQLMSEGRISVDKSDFVFAYHDPCELGRNAGIYQQPRYVIGKAGHLVEIKENKAEAFCCGGSLANLAVSDRKQVLMSDAVTARYRASGAETLVTSCPQCKKSLGRTSTIPVKDISEIVASRIR